MICIQTIHSITHQTSFEQKNVWDTLQPLEQGSTIQAPNYAAYIAPGSLRRLSPILRMSLTAAKACQTAVGAAFDAISVGTSLGCLTDTEKFLIAFHTSTGNVISPTAFIQSTHNTIAGLISMELKNHSYNMTHTQNSLSFEVALVDALMCCREGRSHVLVGAADEATDFLNVLKPHFTSTVLPLTSGTTFLVLGDASCGSGVSIQDVQVQYGVSRTEKSIQEFLTGHGLGFSDMDQVFVSGEALTTNFPNAIDYFPYTGLYLSASAFALHMGHDWLQKHKKCFALIVNEQVKGRLGLILIKRDETLL